MHTLRDRGTITLTHYCLFTGPQRLDEFWYFSGFIEPARLTAPEPDLEVLRRRWHEVRPSMIETPQLSRDLVTNLKQKGLLSQQALLG